MATTSLGIRYPVLSDTANVPRDIGYVAADVDALMVAERAAWTTYAPTLTGSTTSPTGWTATYARYRQRGKTVQVRVKLTAGAGFTAGSGNYVISLPVAAHADMVLYEPLQGLAKAQYASGQTLAPLLPIMGSTTSSVLLAYPSTGGGYLGSTGPGTAWAVGGTLSLTVTYEAA